MTGRIAKEAATKRWILVLVAICLAADYYKATVTRKAADLYLIEYQNPKVYIETQFCYEFAS